MVEVGSEYAKILDNKTSGLGIDETFRQNIYAFWRNRKNFEKFDKFSYVHFNH